MRSRLVTVVLFFLGANAGADPPGAGGGHGELQTAITEEVPVPLQARWLIRVLAYDKNLPRKLSSRKAVTVAVLVPPDRDWEAAARSLAGRFRKVLGEATVSGAPVRITYACYTGAAELAELVESKAVVVLYLAPGLEPDVPAIAEVGRVHAVLTVSGEELQVVLGVSVGFALRNGKLRVLLNLVEAEAEGARFDASLLGVAEIVR